MLQNVMSMFTRKDARRDALSALTRMISRHELVRMAFESGHETNHRKTDEYDISLGVWLFPCDEDDRVQDIDIANGIPAVTNNLRPGGLGILTPMRLDVGYFFIAVPDDQNDDIWKFFKGQVRHNTRFPGGWYHMGVQVEALVELDQFQRVSFRERVAAMMSN